MAEALDKPTRLRLVETLFYEALLQPPELRAGFLSSLAGVDPALRREVERLLAADTKSDDFLAASALGADFIMPAPEALSDGGTPRRIGAYQLVRLLGSGGIGHVWLAQRSDEHFQKDVAIKLIKRGMDTDAILERFRQERQVLARLEHPNIAHLIDGGATDDGLPYLVMEYVNGVPIDRFCEKRAASVNERLELYREVCSAVRYAHQNLVVHRDIKPGNILVTADGRPKLLDFGIAKVLQSDTSTMTVTSAEGRLMTPEYASPEQILGGPITTASDVYSMGVVLFELLTTQLPYGRREDSRADFERLVSKVEPMRPSTAVRRIARGSRASPTAALPEGDATRLSRKLQGDLDTILLKALRKEPSARYASVEQFFEDLGCYLRRLPVSARAPTRLYRTRRFIQRHAAVVFIASMAILAVVTGLVISTRAYLRAEAARQSETRQRQLAEDNRSVAEQESARSAAVIRFLEDMLVKANPAGQGGKPDVTVREVLDSTAALLDSGNSPLAPEEQAVVRLTLGRTYLELSLLLQAEKHLRAALELNRRYPDPRQQGVVQSLHSLGRVLRTMNRLAEAEACQREVLEISRKYQGGHAAHVAQALNSLAILLRLQGRFDDAESAYKEALEIYRQSLGPDHPAVGDTLANLGALLNYRGEPAKAEPLLREALAIHSRGGEESRYTVSDRQNLAHALYATERQDAAMTMLQQAVDIAVKLHGPEHLATAGCQVTLAIWLEKQGDLIVAERLCRAGLAAREKLLPPGHSDITQAREILARIRQAHGN